MHQALPLLEALEREVYIRASSTSAASAGSAKEVKLPRKCLGSSIDTLC